MPPEILHGLRSLFEFGGRDSRRLFGLYVALIWIFFIALTAFLYAEEYLALRNASTIGYPGESWGVEERQNAILIKSAILGALVPLLLTLASLVRRYRDTGASNPVIALLLIFGTFLGALHFIVLAAFFWPSKRTDGPGQ